MKRFTVLLFLFTTALLFLSSGMASAQGGSICSYYAYSPEDRYVEFDSDRFTSGTQNWYSDNHCEMANGSFQVPADGWVVVQGGQGELDATALCDDVLGGTNEVVQQFDIYPSPLATHNSNVWQCHNRAAGSNGRSKARARRKPVYIPPTGVSLNETDLTVTAVDGLHSGIEFQRVDQGGVGIDSVLELGFLDAVDVWSNIGGGYEVCFPQMGEIIFLDAATSPRTVMEIQYEYRDGSTCASLDRAGTLVLVRPTDDGDSYLNEEQPLANCTVTTTHRLNLRDAADGAVVQFVIPVKVTVVAFARTESWFKVVYNETAGWVSARFVTTNGDCAYTMFV